MMMSKPNLSPARAHTSRFLTARETYLIGHALVLAIVYYLTGRLGLSLAVVNPSATAIWPPTGIAIAALLLYGRQLWPGVFFGALAVNLATSHNAGASLLIACGNTLEALAGSYLVSRFARGVAALDRVEDVGRFGVLAGAVAPAISATVGTLTLRITGLSHSAGQGLIWTTWWLGDASGAVLVAPCIILWTRRSRRRRQGFEIVRDGAAAVILFFVALVVFGGFLMHGSHTYAMPFLVVPFVVWAAFRLRPHEAAAGVLVTAGIAVWGALHGIGGISPTGPDNSFLTLQTFMGVVGMTSLLLSAAIAERNTKEEALRISNDALESKVSARTSELQSRITELRDTQEALHSLSMRQMRVQDEERRRISRDLHDAVGQLLAALMMNLSIVERNSPEMESRAAAALEEAKSNGAECVREIRTMSYLLHPPMLTEAGLKPALEWFVKGFSSRSGIDVVLDVPETLPRVADIVEISVFRIVQEALTNVHRHAKSPTAHVEVALNDGSLTISVTDHGQGTLGARDGTGITGMRERLKELQGELRITSSPSGTTVLAHIPVQSAGVREHGQSP